MTEIYDTHDEPYLRHGIERPSDIRDKLENDHEAHKLLDLIVAEFTSDPMSVQCFDLRIVERAKACVAKRKEMEGRDPQPFRTMPSSAMDEWARELGFAQREGETVDEYRALIKGARA